MIVWMLVFCSHVYSGASCLPPQEYRSREACIAVGNALNAAAKKSYGSSSAACIQIRK